MEPKLAVVVARLVERSIPTQEIRGSNLKISKVLPTNYKLNRKDENRRKRGREWPILKREWRRKICPCTQDSMNTSTTSPSTNLPLSNVLTQLPTLHALFKGTTFKPI